MKASYAAEVDDQLQTPAERHRSRLIIVSLITAGWGFWYAMYRAYYGLGGAVGMFGVPRSESQWQVINLTGTAILLVVAALPIAMLPLWKRPRVRPILLGLCWLLAVGFIMHAIIDDIQAGAEPGRRTASGISVVSHGERASRRSSGPVLQ